LYQYINWYFLYDKKEHAPVGKTTDVKNTLTQIVQWKSKMSLTAKNAKYLRKVIKEFLLTITFFFKPFVCFVFFVVQNFPMNNLGLIGIRETTN